jgi:two-component system nitrogen regulation sensor histidine kinase GlnL
MNFQHHAHLFDSMISAVLVINRELQVLYANQAALTFLNTGLKQLYRFHIDHIVAFSTINRDKIKEAFATHEGFSENDVEVCLHDERVLRFDIAVSYVELNQAPCLMIEAKHIDQQKRITQESLQLAQQQAAKQLIRGLAHEIKNPLGGIRGAAQLLSLELKDKEQQEFTQMIMTQSDRLRNLVDNLLGPNSLPKQRLVNLHKPIEEVYQIVRSDNPYNINLVRDYDPSIPDIFVDEDMLLQAVLNIVRNAMQALQHAESKLPKIRIKTRVARNEIIHGRKEPLAAVIYVYDNGPGIPKDIKDTIFYPMVSSKPDGSGLGLSIAQSMVEHHNGKIDLETRKGRTQFAIFIPISKTGERS